MSTDEEDLLKALETEIKNLKRKLQETTWVYEERGRQIERLELALKREREGT